MWPATIMDVLEHTKLFQFQLDNKYPTDKQKTLKVDQWLKQILNTTLLVLNQHLFGNINKYIMQLVSI